MTAPIVGTDQSIDRMGQLITITRESVAETSLKGKPVQGTMQTFTIKAVVIPASTNAMEMLPEGETTTDAIELFTTTQLQETAGLTGTAADSLIWGNRTYRVVMVRSWGKFYQCIATRAGR